ncbi:MAG TPA: hypothetical protein VG675_01500 [Bryobacteraceae bacterium]|nr:hypothetical protein [Bryobacteraceae bacterium]
MPTTQQVAACVALTMTFGGVLAADSFLKDDALVTSVEKTVHELQPSRSEKRFDLVGWVPDILTAEKLARQAQRPVFLFTYDGSINTGRC